MPVTSAPSPRHTVTLQPGDSSKPQDGNKVEIRGNGEIRAAVKILGSNSSDVTNTLQGAPITVEFTFAG